jgi:hypothetical protein
MSGRPRSSKTAVLVVGLVLAFALPAQAAIASPQGTTASSRAPATAPSPAIAHAWLHLPDGFSVDRQAVTVAGRVVHVAGGMWPYVSGQWVTLRAYVGSRLIRSGGYRLEPHGKYGEFTAAITSPASGNLTITVTHPGTSKLAAFEVQRGLETLNTNVGFGAKGRLIQLVQQRLAALHFYIPQTGVYDQGTGLALDAYHRLLRWGTSQTLDSRTIDALLDGYGTFRVRFPHQGRHAEGDLALQLLALVDGSRVDAIYPISSGKPSTPTILGEFQVYLKVPGYLPDGMFDSNFFIRGYAVHGYNPAPDYPASHGCMRLPIVDAPSVYAWLQIGDWVDTYY